MRKIIFILLPEKNNKKNTNPEKYEQKMFTSILGRFGGGQLEKPLPFPFMCIALIYPYCYLHRKRLFTGIWNNLPLTLLKVTESA
jgi:hypothetical protein